MKTNLAVFSTEQQAGRYVRDVLQFGRLQGRVLWALSAEEADLFRRILARKGVSDRVTVVVGADGA